MGLYYFEKALKRAFFILCSLGILWGVSKLLKNSREDKASEEIQAEASSAASPKPDDKKVAASTTATQEKSEEQSEKRFDVPKTVNFDSMDNSNVVAWVSIPSLDIDYPVMQCDDNEFYLNHAADGSVNHNGSIFMASENDSSYNDRNTMIFGHNMKNGSMFGALKKVTTSEKPIEIFVYTRDGQVRKYQVFSSYVTTEKSDMYRLSDTDAKAKAYVAEAVQNNQNKAFTEPENTDAPVLTLATCAGVAGQGGRLLVHASLVGKENI